MREKKEKKHETLVSMDDILIRNNAQHCACPDHFLYKSEKSEKKTLKRNHVENHFSLATVFQFINLPQRHTQSVTNLCVHIGTFNGINITLERRENIVHMLCLNFEQKE